MGTKSLQIPEAVHTELKTYAAKTKTKMNDLSGLLIMEALQARGHKFHSVKASDKKTAKK